MKLEGSRFGRELSERWIPIVKRMGPGPPAGQTEVEWSARQFVSLSCSQRYDLACLYSFGDVLHAETRIELASALFSRTPRSMRLPAKVSKRHVWLDYNLVHFFGGIITLRDTLLLLTVAVARLGLEPEKSTFTKIVHHPDVKGTPLLEHVRTLCESWNTHRVRRNRILHRAEVASLATYVGQERATFAHMVSMVEEGLKNGNSRDLTRTTWHFMIRFAAPKLRSEKEAIILAAERLLDYLADIAMETRAMLDSR